MLIDDCKKIESESLIHNKEIFEDFGLLMGNPWQEVVNSEITTYYNCLYKIVNMESPKTILEIGTAFGMSAATMLKASSDLELFISLDLGIYGEQLGFSQNNIDFARTKLHTWCCRNDVPLDRVRFYKANSQPAGIGDNENIASDVLRWHQIPDLVRLLTGYEFDVIFVDGKHTDNGLLNDFKTFWPFLKEGGLIICDDLHDEVTYKNIFPWAGQTIDSFNTFRKAFLSEIEDSYIWNYPHVIPADFTGLRPFGFIRKRKRDSSTETGEGFEVFDTQEALKINRARLEHLTSLGLDLAHKRALEVGAGVGRHTEFFEKLGCEVVSTDARPENVEEHLRRYPHRKGRVEVADLNKPDSHKKYGSFDIVYCYGTLYHLNNPEHCIRDLSENCKELFLLETCVNPEDNGQINSVKENSETKNQSYSGGGCRPARDWIFQELKKYYSHVYISKFQPNHPDYPLRWPALAENLNNTRAVFIGSKNPLGKSSLSLDLLRIQNCVDEILIKKPKDKKESSKTHEIRTFAKARKISIPLTIFYKEGNSLIESFEFNFYGDDVQKSIDLVKNHSIFIPTTGNDHIASPYFVLMNKSHKSEKRIRITMTFRPEQTPMNNFSFSIQDEKFRILYSCPSSKISVQPDNVFHQVIPLISKFQKLRIIFRTSRETPMPIPISLKVEKLVTII
jgi:predicted O-methyltransferase YrrM